MSDPWKIIRVGKLKYTRNRRYRIGVNFGMYWAAYIDCKCSRYCHCEVKKFRSKAAIAGTGFRSLKAIQEAIYQCHASKSKRGAQ